MSELLAIASPGHDLWDVCGGVVGSTSFVLGSFSESGSVGRGVGVSIDSLGFERCSSERGRWVLLE